MMFPVGLCALESTRNQLQTWVSEGTRMAELGRDVLHPPQDRAFLAVHTPLCRTTFSSAF